MLNLSANIYITVELLRKTLDPRSAAPASLDITARKKLHRYLPKKSSNNIGGMDNFQRLNEDMLQEIYDHMDFIELMRMRRVAPRHKAALMNDRFIRQYYQSRNRPMWNIIHGFSLENPVNHWVTAVRDDGLNLHIPIPLYPGIVLSPMEEPFQEFDNPGCLIAIHDSNLVFHRSRGAFWIFNLWTHEMLSLQPGLRFYVMKFTFYKVPKAYIRIQFLEVEPKMQTMVSHMRNGDIS